MKRTLYKYGMIVAMLMLIVLGIPMSLSADAQVTRKESGLQSYPVEASTQIYKGGLVCINAAGYLVPGADAASYKFAGVAYENVLGTTQGAKSCRVHTSGVFKLTATSITQAMVGQMMYLTDDATIDDTTGSTYYIPVGRLVEYVSTTSGWVDIGQRHLIGGADDVILAPNATNMLEVHTWGIVVKAVAGSCSLYLAADYGAYLNSWAVGSLEICAATTVRMRVGGKGFSVDSTGAISTAYGILCTGRIHFPSTGSLGLPQKTDPVTPPTEGDIWYNTTQDKLQFRTAAGIETVTSS